MTAPSRPCFVCGAAVEQHTPLGDRYEAQPSGTVLTALGNIGSGVWDPTSVDGLRLTMVVCDPCMRSHACRVRIRYGISRGCYEGDWRPDEGEEAAADRLTRESCLRRG